MLHEHFLVKILDGVPFDKEGPILWDGITMYDPLRTYGATEGKKMTVGVIGAGELGTMRIKLAKTLGHKVITASTSESKRLIALDRGADKFVVSTIPQSMNSQIG